MEPDELDESVDELGVALEPEPESVDPDEELDSELPDPDETEDPFDEPVRASFL